MPRQAESKRARILLVGGTGQVGWELVRTLAPLGALHVRDHSSLDLTDQDALRAAVRECAPDVIVNAAAYTSVDKAEAEEALAQAINGTAPGVLGEEAARCNAVLVHYSTDYVFDGAATVGYRETDATSPLNAYGRSKLAGETAILGSGAAAYVFRVSWIYGQRGRNFLKTIQRLAASGSALRIVADQRGAPTWSRMVAEATGLAVGQTLVARRTGAELPATGVYHMTAPDHTTWHEFASSIVQAGAAGTGTPAPEVLPVSTAEYPTAAARPLSSVLDSSKLARVFGVELPSWREQLRLCLESAA